MRISGGKGTFNLFGYSGKYDVEANHIEVSRGGKEIFSGSLEALTAEANVDFVLDSRVFKHIDRQFQIVDVAD